MPNSTVSLPNMELDRDLRLRLEAYEGLLRRWQSKINLVGRSTISEVWTRHFEDSMQLASLVERWSVWIDLGSGGGFPGLVIAIVARNSGRSVHLIESDKRKAAFLREVSRETGADATIHVGRIEDVLLPLCSKIHVDVISARALAPAKRLIELSHPALQKGATGLFLKGKGLIDELTEIGSDDSLKIKLIDSRTDTESKIMVVQRAASSVNSK